jgi:hypothetical protein
MYCLI